MILLSLWSLWQFGPDHAKSEFECKFLILDQVDGLVSRWAMIYGYDPTWIQGPEPESAGFRIGDLGGVFGNYYPSNLGHSAQNALKIHKACSNEPLLSAWLSGGEEFVQKWGGGCEGKECDIAEGLEGEAIILIIWAIWVVDTLQQESVTCSEGVRECNV